MDFKETVEFSIFATVWNFFKRYYQVQDDDSYWDELIEESNQIAVKYGNNKFANDLLVATIKELERRLKKGQNITS